MGESADIEHVVRTRLRSLRTTLGLSLDELSARTHLSPSTISRVETGKRTISLDVLLPLAAGLQVGLEALLDVSSDDDVVIRPAPSRSGTRTTWNLSRPGSSHVAIKMRLEPNEEPVQQRVHPGHDWLFVLSGRIRRVTRSSAKSMPFTPRLTLTGPVDAVTPDKADNVVAVVSEGLSNAIRHSGADAISVSVGVVKGRTANTSRG